MYDKIHYKKKKKKEYRDLLFKKKKKKESACQCRRWGLGFDPCVRKIPWSRKWLPTPVFLPGKFHS